MQLFDFVLSFTAGFAFLSYPRDIKVWIAAQHDLPYREELLEQNADRLLLGIFVVFVTVLTIKVLNNSNHRLWLQCSLTRPRMFQYYLMNMVWSSYKFLELQRRQQASPTERQLEAGESDEVVAVSIKSLTTLSHYIPLPELLLIFSLSFAIVTFSRQKRRDSLCSITLSITLVRH